MGIFLTQINETLEQTLAHHIEITMVRALLDQSGKGSYKFKVDDQEMIEALAKAHYKVFKAGLGARPPGGSDPRKWPPERRDAFLTAYEEALEKMSRAKRIYRINRRDKSWPDMVRAAFPDMPGEFIDRLSGRGDDAEPNTLAREYAAKQFGAEPNEYLEKVLIAARRRRREAADTES